MLPIRLDHCVIHVTDWERSNAFYTAVMGAELIARPVGYAYRFGDRQLNVHGPGVEAAELARLPVAPGNSDLCFEWSGPIADAMLHLQRHGIAVERGPLQRFGAKGAGTSVYFRDPDGSLMEFISYGHYPEKRSLGFAEDRAQPASGAQSMTGAREAPGKHDPTVLPPGIPAPQDDGAARHLTGMSLPDVALPATKRGAFNLAHVPGRTVLYIYPRTGVPGVDLPPGWDDIPGARGCTPQSCSFRDHFAELKELGVAHVFGLSTQDTDYQREAAERLHLPFPILSDDKLAFTRALRLPTFAVAGTTLLKRMALVIDDGVIVKVFYPVFPPDKSAAEVVAWLRSHG
jgi:peroxiredoxin/catechol 2,3-dioxygenase-like lactoylglutathione lyase family enzyme